MAQVTSHLLNCSDRLLLNQIDCLRPLGLLGPWEPQSAFCLIRTFLGLMFMRFHTSAVVRSALVTPLKSNVVIRGRVHSTYCLWGRLGLGASPHQNLLPPPPAAALSPNCKEWRDQRIIWGETESPLMDSKTCLKVATPFSALAWQNTGVGFLLSPPPCPRELSFGVRALTYTPSLPLWDSRGVSGSGAVGGQPTCSPLPGAGCCCRGDRVH